MMEAAVSWQQAIQMVQALLVPALIYLTRVLAKLSDRLDQVEKDQVRTNALLETRANQRMEDKADIRDVLQKLEAAMTRLADRTERDNANH